MAFFNRWAISWPIFVLYLLQGIVKSSDDGVRVSNNFRDTPTFNHLEIHKDDGNVFIGAENRLYKLTPDLKLLAKVATTDVTGSKNYNKILVINYNESELITCGSSDIFLYVTYDYKLEDTFAPKKELIVGGTMEISKSAPIVAFIGKHYENQNNITVSKLYVAVSYSDYSNYFPPIAIRTLNPNELFQMDEGYNGSESTKFNIKYRDEYGVKFVHGFNSGKYNYFLTTRRNSTTQGSSYISKLIRICYDGKHFYRGYAEIPIECNSNKKRYNLVQAANVGKPGSLLQKSLEIGPDDDVLFGVFSKSAEMEATTDKPSNESALCIYSLKAIDEKFNENIQNCFDGNGYQGFENVLSNQRCQKVNQTVDLNFCASSLNMPLDGGTPITQHPVITFSTLLTAVTTKLSENHNDVFIGTNTGHLKKVIVNNFRCACEIADVPIDEGSPVNSDLLFSPNNNYLYILTEHTLSRINVSVSLVDCSKYENYDACVQNASAYCGWCEITRKCSTKCDCFHSKYCSWTTNEFEKNARSTGNSFDEFQSDNATISQFHNAKYNIPIFVPYLLFIIVFPCIICKKIKMKYPHTIRESQQEINIMHMEAVAVKQCLKRVVIKNEVTLHENSSRMLKLPTVKIENTSFARNSIGTSRGSGYIIPLDDEWEFPRSNLTLGRCVGEGEFGKVVVGEAKNILEENITTTVAVKMLKDNHSDNDMIDLVSEMEILKLIGTHVNVLRLLGCCTQEGTFLMITEYAQHGNLREFLRKHLPSDGEITSINMSQETLRMFSVQVANGMQHLASMKCIHRDLAARNILVFDDYTLKIADFGLSRDITNKEYYKKRADGRLPVKWMAPESLCYNIYSVQSDVWSYGVVLWEIFTLGGAPYPSLMDMGKLYQALRSGYRMEKPPNCSEKIYNLMRKCWSFSPKDRPSFSSIVNILQDTLWSEDSYLYTSQTLH